MDELQVVVGAATDAGTVREENEDAVLVDTARVDDALRASNGLLLGIADGVGGYQRGEVASRIAIDTLMQNYYAAPVGPTDTPQQLKRAFRAANDLIFTDGSAEGEANIMGTTLVAAVIRGNDLTVANVGDSRAYLVRANRATQVTHDHSLVAEQVDAGAMTQQEARESPHRNIITRMLGHRQRVDVDVFEIRLLPDDRLLLTTDGVHDYVDESEMVQVTLSKPPEEAARELVQMALGHGSNDNVSAVVARFTPAGVPAEREPVAVEGGRNSMLVPLLAVIGLVVFVAIVVLILFLT